MALPAQTSAARYPHAIRLLRLPQVQEVTGLGKTKIYELQSQGRFPRSVKITAYSVGWVESEVQDWVASRIGTRRRWSTGRPPGRTDE